MNTFSSHCSTGNINNDVLKMFLRDFSKTHEVTAHLPPTFYPETKPGFHSMFTKDTNADCMPCHRQGFRSGDG